MTFYSIEPKDQIFVQGYGLLSFTKNIYSKNIGKSISKNLNGKNSQKLLDHAKQSLLLHLKLVYKNNSKNSKITSELIGNKIADKTIKDSPQNSSDT